VSDGTDLWRRACLALHLLAEDPQGLGGLVLRARAGPVRDRFLEAFRAMIPAPVTRLHPALGPEELLGGLDLTATLQNCRRVMSHGLAERTGPFVLAMAERCPPDLAALLAQALDRGQMRPLLLLDEGADSDERPPKALSERLAFHIDLDGVGLHETIPVDDTPLPNTATETPDEDSALTLTLLAAQFGIDSLRAPLFALQAARALARLNDKTAVGGTEIRAAVELVYPHRATRMPHPPAEEETAQQDPPPPPENDEATDKGDWKQSKPCCQTIFWMDCAMTALHVAALDRARDNVARAIGAGGPCRRAGVVWTDRPESIWWPRCAPPRPGKRCGALMVRQNWRSGRRTFTSNGTRIVPTGFWSLRSTPPALPRWPVWEKQRARSNCCWRRPMRNATMSR
jgi:hypothetical protein